MCPPHSNPRKSSTHQAAVFRYRASFARCITTFGYRRVNDAAVASFPNSSELLCYQCKELIPSGTLSYRLSLSHAIKLGRVPPPDRCECCRAQLSIAREIEHCDACSDAFLLALQTLPEFNLNIEDVDSRFVLDSTDAPSDVIISRRLVNFSLSLLERE